MWPKSHVRVEALKPNLEMLQTKKQNILGPHMFNKYFCLLIIHFHSYSPPSPMGEGGIHEVFTIFGYFSTMKLLQIIYYTNP